MERQPHNEPFEEHYWEEALGVLKKEERKQTLRKAVPLLLLLLLISGAAMFFIPSQEQQAKTAKTNQSLHPSTEKTLQAEANKTTATESSVSTQNDVDPDEMNALAETSEDTNSSASIAEQTADEEVAPTQIPTRAAQTPKEEIAVNDQENVNDNTPAASDAPAQDAEDTAQQDGTPTDDPEVEQPALSVEDPVTPEDDSPNFELPVSNPDLSPMNATQKPLSGKPTLALLQPRSMKYAGCSGTLRLTSYEDKHAKFLRLPSKPQQLSVYIGNSFVNGYGASSSSTPFNPQLGLAFDARIARKLWLRSSIGVQRISEVRQVREYVEEQSTFGYRAIQTVISSDQLYLGDVGAQLIWDMNLRHSLFAGAGLEIVALTVNTVTTNEIDAFSTEQLEEKVDYGYLTGYDPFFANASIGYRYRLSRLSTLDIFAQTGGKEVADQGKKMNSRIGVRWNIDLF